MGRRCAEGSQFINQDFFAKETSGYHYYVLHYTHILFLLPFPPLRDLCGFVRACSFSHGVTKTPRIHVTVHNPIPTVIASLSEAIYRLAHEIASLSKRRKITFATHRFVCG